MGRGLAHTRQADRKAKVKAGWVARTLWGWDGSLVTPGRIGRLASVHCRACKCCGARGARAWGGDTVQERRAADDARQQLAELNRVQPEDVTPKLIWSWENGLSWLTPLACEIR